MSRQISLDGGTSTLPVTDASMSSSREPVMEQSLNGKGGEILYGGVYGAVQGSFSGAYRPDVFQTYLEEILKTSPASYDVVIYDDAGNALQSPTTYITSAEISMKVGELCKCNFSFVGQGINTLSGQTPAAAPFDAEVPVFYKSYTSWGVCSEFTLRIERPYAADDYTIGGNFYSESIYQSGDTKVSGTVKLTQTEAITNSDPGTITLTLGYHGGTTKTITIKNAVLSNIEMGISGRGLISKTRSWAAPSTTGASGILFT